MGKRKRSRRVRPGTAEAVQMIEERSRQRTIQRNERQLGLADRPRQREEYLHFLAEERQQRAEAYREMLETQEQERRRFDPPPPVNVDELTQRQKQSEARFREKVGGREEPLPDPEPFRKPWWEK